MADLVGLRRPRHCAQPESERPMESSAARAAINRVPSRQRSRITNGSALLPGASGRTAWVRRCRDIIALHLADLGGDDNTSAAERSIVRRAAVLTTELEMLEARFATAGQATATDLDLYIRASGNLRRLLEAVGIQRRPKDVTPSVAEYLKSKATVEIEVA
jgi:hypothetical protein